MNRSRMLFVLLLMGSGILSRMLPHPPNFTPVLALGLFGGAFLPSRLAAIGCSVAMVLLTDIWIVLHDVLPAQGTQYLPEILLVNLTVYISVGLIALLGKQVRFGNRVGSSLLSGAGACVLFFGLTNVASWFAFYDKSWSGLVTCFINALPYFKNTCLSTGLYGALMIFALRLGEWKFPMFRDPFSAPQMKGVQEKPARS